MPALVAASARFIPDSALAIARIRRVTRGSPSSLASLRNTAGVRSLRILSSFISVPARESSRRRDHKRRPLGIAGRPHESVITIRRIRLTGGYGPAIIMEMLANVNLQKDLGIIGMHGRIVVIGNRGTVEINARFAMNKNANILGMALTHASPFELAGIHAALVEGLRNGSLRPAIAQELPLSQAARSHEAVLEPGHHGKIILVP